MFLHSFVLRRFSLLRLWILHADTQRMMNCTIVCDVQAEKSQGKTSMPLHRGLAQQCIYKMDIDLPFFFFPFFFFVWQFISENTHKHVHDDIMSVEDFPTDRSFAAYDTIIDRRMILLSNARVTATFCLCFI